MKSKESIEKAVYEILESIMLVQKSEIDPDAPLAEIGVDSVIAAETVREINTKLKIGMDSQEFYSTGSINGLIASLAKKAT